MNSHLSHSLLELGGLYAPQSRQRASENVQCADVIGIAGVATGHTPKFLSAAVVLSHRATGRDGACPRSIGRIDANQPNTVRCRAVFDPGEYLAVGPRCDGFPKRLVAALSLAALHIVQGLHAQHGDIVQVQLVDDAPDEVIPFPVGAAATLAAGFAAPDLSRMALNSVP
jgi:hypothetical protein